MTNNPNEQLSMNMRLKLAGIETVLTGRDGDFSLPQKGLTNGTVCILRPKYEECISACREHFGVEI